MIPIIKRLALPLIASAAVSVSAFSSELKDLNYGTVLYEFHQQNYFNTLVEFAYAEEKGGIENHGSYPTLLKGGVSFSYGLNDQARELFQTALNGNVSPQDQNRVWYHVARMAYENGDIKNASKSLSQIVGLMPLELQADFQYLSSIIYLRLGEYKAVEELYQPVSNKDKLAPYIIYNLAIAQAKQNKIQAAIKSFNKAAEFTRGIEHKAIADRANLALNYLLVKEGESKDALQKLQNVHSTGFYSNRALLTYAWLAINDQKYKRSLSPLKALSKRSIAIPEVQEAVLLIPHVYERLKLKGRAQQGFIGAGKDYQKGLQDISKLRSELKSSKNLRLLTQAVVANENSKSYEGDVVLSPYLINLLSDHTFQSVLNEMMDLQHIEISLSEIINKEKPLKQMIDARSRAASTGGLTTRFRAAIKRQRELSKQHKTIAEKVDEIGHQYSKKDQQRVAALMDFLEKELNSIEQTIDVIKHSQRFSNEVKRYKKAIKQQIAEAKTRRRETQRLLRKLDKVLYKLISNELDIHQQRFKYYLVQSRLAKARLYDSVLQDIDPLEEQEKAASEK